MGETTNLNWCVSAGFLNHQQYDRHSIKGLAWNNGFSGSLLLLISSVLMIRTPNRLKTAPLQRNGFQGPPSLDPWNMSILLKGKTQILYTIGPTPASADSSFTPQKNKRLFEFSNDVPLSSFFMRLQPDMPQNLYSLKFKNSEQNVCLFNSTLLTNKKPC